MVMCTGHIGIHEGAGGRTYARTYVRMDVHDVMAIKQFSHINGLPYFLNYGAPHTKSACGAPLLFSS